MLIGDKTDFDGHVPSRYRTADVVLYVYFILCLVPVIYGTMSVNYLFLLYPLWSAASGRQFRLPSRGLLAALGWYTAIFIAGAMIDAYHGAFGLRSFISYVLFVSIFALMFFNITAREIRLFKYAVLTVALFLSAQAFLHFFWAGGNAVGFSQKDIVGSQRYGFIYIIALFVVMSRKTNLSLTPVMKILAMTCLLAGMLLTFSRSTVIAFTTVAVFYTILVAIDHSVLKAEATREIAKRYGVILTALAALLIVMPVTFQFYRQQIVARYIPVLGYTIDSGSKKLSEKDMAMVQDVFNSAGSEGTRIELWSLIFDRVDQNPILGSHYLGIWTLPGAPSGSSHNQLMDVLLRTGWPGLAIYVVLLARLLLCLFRNDRALFWGLLATLVFGIFHETFKESQGAFILSLLVGILATKVDAARKHEV